MCVNVSECTIKIEKLFCIFFFLFLSCLWHKRNGVCMCDKKEDRAVREWEKEWETVGDRVPETEWRRW